MLFLEMNLKITEHESFFFKAHVKLKKNIYIIIKADNAFADVKRLKRTKFGGGGKNF